DEVAILVAEVDAVDLLDRAPGEPAAVLDELLELRGHLEAGAPPDQPVPLPVRAREHRVDARQTTDVAAHNPVGRIEERRRSEQVPVWSLPGVLLIAPQRVGVADAVRPVADRVLRRLFDMRLRQMDVLADARTKRLELRLGDAGRRSGALRIVLHNLT